MNLNAVEIKAFVPAKEFALSKRFYQDMGFVMASEGGGVAYFHHQKVSFLLQDFYVKEFADNLMMHMLVEDVEAWRSKMQNADIANKYQVRIGAIEQQPWGMRDFVMTDPSGVLWRIGQNTD